MSYVPGNVYGPWLRYQDWDLISNAWIGSVLVVSTGQQPPYLSVLHSGQHFTPQPDCLDIFQTFSCWRWQLDLYLLPQESSVEYSVTAEWYSGQPSAKVYSFTLPGQAQCWHFGFHSCNGFSHGVNTSWEQAGTALWRDVLSVHAGMPLHAMVGGGDQLYNDGFFKEPSMVQWLGIKDRQAREQEPVNAAMDAQISHFMFHHYCNWFSKDDMAEAFACIPQVMIYDDHDIMDGWGSYPDQLQTSPVFQLIFRTALRFYLLFQQHTVLSKAHQQGNLFGAGQSFSLLRQMGRGVALVAPDVRAERTRKQVVSPASWQLIFDRIAALPLSVHHLIMVTTIPVVYPKIPLSEKAMGLMSTLGREHAVDMLLSKTGLWGAVRGKVISDFNEPELLDDLLDHWTSDFHTKEREMLIRRLQDVARSRNTRVTFISGDVHVAGLGRLYSHPKMDLRQDPRFMPQVVSSAIMNAPPPAGVVATLHTCSNAHMSGIDRHTKEKMVRIFKADYPKTEKLLARRNWATLRELPMGVPPATVQTTAKDAPLQPGDLLVVLRVEHDHTQPQLPVRQYPIPVPMLEPQAGAYGPATPAYPAAQGTYAAIPLPAPQANAQPAPYLQSYNSVPAAGYGNSAGQHPSPAAAYAPAGYQTPYATIAQQPLPPGTAPFGQNSIPSPPPPYGQPPPSYGSVPASQYVSPYAQMLYGTPAQQQMPADYMQQGYSSAYPQQPPAQYSGPQFQSPAQYGGLQSQPPPVYGGQTQHEESQYAAGQPSQSPSAAYGQHGGYGAGQQAGGYAPTYHQVPPGSYSGYQAGRQGDVTQQLGSMSLGGGAPEAQSGYTGGQHY